MAYVARRRDRALPWYDRNPLNIVKVYANTVGPHASTQRWSYTVPTGRKAMMEELFDEVFRASTASANGGPTCDIYYTPSGGSQSYLCESIISNVTAGAGPGTGAYDKTIMGQGIILYAGDNVACYTLDAGSGGTVSYICSAKLTEFDAVGGEP
jgi:hypothetical protein